MVTRCIPRWLAIALALSFAPPAIAAQREPAPNPSFEKGAGTEPEGWDRWGQGRFEWDASVARTGTRSLSISHSDYGTAWKGPEFEVDGSYATAYPWWKATAWVKAKGATGNTRLVLAWFDGDKWIGNVEGDSAPAGTYEWRQIAVAGLPPVGARRCQLYLRSDANAGTIWFDDVSASVNEVALDGAWEPLRADEDGAVAPYLRFAGAKPDDELAITGLLAAARIQECAGKGAEAIGLLEAAAGKATGPARHRALLRAAGIAATRKEYSKAAALLGALRSGGGLDQETDVEAMLAEADLEARQKHNEKALAAYDRIASQYPRAKGVAMYAKGIACLEWLSDSATARQLLLDCEPLLRADPSNADRLYRLPFYQAVAEFETNPVKDRAIAMFDAIIAGDPATSHRERASLMRAEALFCQEHYEDALAGFQALDKAQEREVGAAAMYWRARSLIALGRVEEALHCTELLESAYADQGMSRMAGDLRGRAKRGR